MINWYKLEFTTPIHIGERGIGIESVTTKIHSTTIHAAIVNALIMLGKLSPKLKKDELIKVTSSFKVTTPSPYIDSKYPLLWIQGVHLLLSRNLPQEAIRDPRIYSSIIKMLKKVNLATFNFFKEDLSKCKIICSGADVYSSVEIICNKNQYEIIGTDQLHGNIIIEKDVLKKPVNIAEQVIRPKNIIDRITNAAYPYHLGLIQYYEPLVLGVEIADKDYISLKDVEEALKLIGEIGVGGKRTYGFGEFAYAKIVMENVIPLQINNNKGIYVVQGLFSPKLENMAEILEESIYTIKIHGSRSGFTGAIRRPIIALTEGSIIKCKYNCDGIIAVDNDGVFSKIIRSFNPIKIPIRTYIGDL